MTAHRSCFLASLGQVMSQQTTSGRIQSTSLLGLHVDQEPASLHTPGGLLHLLAGTQCHEHSLHRVAGIRAQHDEAASPDLRCDRGCRSQKLWAQQKFGGCSSARTGAGARRRRQEAVDAWGARTVIAGTKLTFHGTHLLGADCGQHLFESLRSSREGVTILGCSGRRTKHRQAERSSCRKQAVQQCCCPAQPAKKLQHPFLCLTLVETREQGQTPTTKLDLPRWIYYRSIVVAVHDDGEQAATKVCDHVFDGLPLRCPCRHDAVLRRWDAGRHRLAAVRLELQALNKGLDRNRKTNRFWMRA